MISEIAPFTFKIEDAFLFQSGVTVLTGSIIDGHPVLLAPCRVELVIDGEARAVLELESERMSGDGPGGRRAVETRAQLPIADIRASNCLLVHR